MTLTAGTILLGIALLLLVALFVARPFVVAANQQQAYPPTPYEQLLTQKEGLLEEIRALDFDHQTGKIPDEVYEPKRQQLVTQAAMVAQQLDILAADGVSVDGEQAPDLEAQIEAAVASLRTPQAKPGAPAKAKTSAPPPTPAYENGRFCTECGQPVHRQDKFCANCGHKLTPIAEAS